MKTSPLVETLMQKASHDIYILEKLVDDCDAPVEVFGFHAQQASEKILKAALASRQLLFPRTHRLSELADIAKDNSIELPNFVEELIDLTPFAVDFRYDVAPLDNSSSFDKTHVLSLVRKLFSIVSDDTTNIEQ